MIVAMQESSSEDQIQHVIDQLVRMGFEVHRSTGARQTVLGGVGAPHDFDIREVEMMPGVQEAHRISSPYKLAGRNFRPEGTVVKFANGLEVGGPKVVVMAGPCSVESREQLFAVSEQIAKAGARALRGGAFKPRSSPYSFQGMGLEGLKLLREGGDPPRGTGRREKVAPGARAWVAAGAYARGIEADHHPDKALCEGAHSLSPGGFGNLVEKLRTIPPGVGGEPA